MEAKVKTPVIVYAESTPNPSAMKFVANKMLSENLTPLEFLNASDARSSPFASELFKFPFVKSVFISGNYTTVFKSDTIEWDDVILELREFIRVYLGSGKAIIDASLSQSTLNGGHAASPEELAKSKENNALGSASVEHTVPQGETEIKIVNVLEQYIRPAVEQDGGMIVFRSYKDGIVSLLMRGACSGCPSSTSTLKGGIEALLKKFVPEVKGVVSE